MLNRDVVYYDFDNFRLDLEKQQLLKNGEPVLLTHKAFQTLHILVQNNGQLVEKENIYNSLWSDSFVEESNLTQYIYLLRKTLDKNSSGASYIETVSRRGYVFNADIEPGFAPSKPQTTNGSNDENSHLWLSKSDSGVTQDISEAPQSIDARQNPPEKPNTFMWLRAGAVAACAIAVSLLIFQYYGNGRQASPAASNTDVSSIAVLPFKPIDDESRIGKLGFGMADAIITRLSNLKQIPVRPTSSVFKYIDEPPPSHAAAGKELGVEAVLEGTVQRDGERVRVSVQLFNVSDGTAIWAEKFDERYTDVFSLQDSIAAKVVTSLALKLTPQQWISLEQKTTSSPEALDAYQLGVYFWNTRSKENLLKAEASFQKAIGVDPQFAKAHAMLADTYNMLGYYDFADRAEMRSKASEATAKALVIDPTVAEAHIANAFIQFTPTDVNAAKISIDRAIELAPYNSTARLRNGWILLRLGRPEEAAREMRLAREYDPLSSVSNGALCNILTYSENFAEAVEACRRSVDLSNGLGGNRLSLANALFFSGNTREAIELAKLDIEADNRKYSAMGNLGYYYAKLGQRGEAERMLTEVKQQSASDPMLLVDVSLIEFTLGRPDAAFAVFRDAYKKRSISRSLFFNDPTFKELRGDVRFATLMRD